MLLYCSKFQQTQSTGQNN